MSKCPICGWEIPPMTDEEKRAIMHELAQDKSFMRYLGIKAASQMIADGKLDELLKQNGWVRT